MSTDTRTCSFCGALIPAADFADGVAVVVLRRTYCKRCADRAVRQKTKDPRATDRRRR